MKTRSVMAQAQDWPKDMLLNYSQNFYTVELTWNDAVEDRGRLMKGCS